MPDVDLFATRLNSQLARFVSWKPDPEALFYDAFSRLWDAFTPYIFPPFSLLGRVLAKIQNSKVQQAIVIAPCWETRPWCPTLLSMLYQSPPRLLRNADLLTRLSELHPLKNSLVLAAWPLSGNSFATQEFLNPQQTLSLSPGEREPTSNMLQRGNSMVAGVIGSKLILFKHL